MRNFMNLVAGEIAFLTGRQTRAADRVSALRFRAGHAIRTRVDEFVFRVHSPTPSCGSSKARIGATREDRFEIPVYPCVDHADLGADSVTEVCATLEAESTCPRPLLD